MLIELPPVEKVVAYSCSECGQLHIEAYDAQRCCPPLVQEGWLCNSTSHCYEMGVHSTKALALECQRPKGGV